MVISATRATEMTFILFMAWGEGHSSVLGMGTPPLLRPPRDTEPTRGAGQPILPVERDIRRANKQVQECFRLHMVRSEAPGLLCAFTPATHGKVR